MPESGYRICPYCKEEIKADAIRCKHCRSSLAPEKPTHDGTCPYCKESIHVEAVKCKHCGSMVGAKSGCGCAEEPMAATSLSVPLVNTRPGDLINPETGGTALLPKTRTICGACDREWPSSSPVGYIIISRICRVQALFRRADGSFGWEDLYTWYEYCSFRRAEYLDSLG